jgi:RNA polymerase sigma-70 factor (ECF subfamily)
MPLSLLFMNSACPEIRAAFAGGAEIERCLQQLVEAAQRAHPAAVVSAEQFVAFMARHLTKDLSSIEALSALHVEDLYLACAYGMGDPAVFDQIESQYLSAARAALLRLRVSTVEIEDLLSELRRRLVEMQDQSSQRRGYSGRGSLKGWLVLCAVREAEARKYSTRREQPIEQAWPEIPGVMSHPDTHVLLQRYKADFQSAFRDAVTQLTPRERNLLRYCYLDRLTGEQIARLYRVHRATAARWVTHAQEQLAEHVRVRFLARVGVHAESMEQIVAEIQSQLSLSLGALLTPGVESEAHAE